MQAKHQNISSDEITELLFYEELDHGDDKSSSVSNPYQRTIRSMYNKIPLNPFRATVRISRLPKSENNLIDSFDNSAEVTLYKYSGSTASSIRSIGRTPQALEIVTTDGHGQLMLDNEYDSPASFPATPFSRAYVMNRSTEKVTSVMFAARDVLRLEAQSVSKDDYSRQQAKEAQSSGQFAIFDPRQSSTGLSLTCGNHCVMKVGQGQCSCCRSMIPIHTNTYVYFEFSITVSGCQAPTLGIGLTPPDAPLNTMVGSWPRSVGLYSDGQVLIGSRWYQSSNRIKIQAGSTVGMLVYVPSSSTLSDHQELIQDTTALKSNDIRDNNSYIRSQASVTAGEEKLYFHFTLDGARIVHVLEASDVLYDIVELNTPLFPTVGIFSMDTRVWCRFCEADIVYRSRQAVGAPEGVRVYCLDGSVLLQEDEN